MERRGWIPDVWRKNMTAVLKSWAGEKELNFKTNVTHNWEDSAVISRNGNGRIEAIF